MSIKNTLLFDTAIGSQNLGDEIILESVKRGLRSIIQNSSVYTLGTHIENFSPLQMLRPDEKVRFFSKSMDHKFICGSSLLISSFRTLHPLFRLNCFNIPLYKGAVLVGVGKSSAYSELGRIARYLYTHTLSKEYMHSVRDDETKAIIESIGVKAVNTGCPTICELTPQKCALIPMDKAENAVFSVSGQKKYHDPEADAYMIGCLKKNYARLFAWKQTSADENYLRTLIDPDEECIELVYSLDKNASLLDKGNTDYIGTRLHGGIFALQHNCRSLIVSIDHRAEGLYKSNNIPIIRRRNIASLDEQINSPIKTDIRLRQSDIDAVLEQFVKQPMKTSAAQ